VTEFGTVTHVTRGKSLVGQSQCHTPSQGAGPPCLQCSGNLSHTYVHTVWPRATKIGSIPRGAGEAYF